MRTFVARATVSFDVYQTFEMSDELYKRAMTKYGNLDEYAAKELDGGNYEAQGITSGSEWIFRGVSETTRKEETR